MAPGEDEVWFGIFMRVQNESKSETFRTADTFEMEDTAGLTFEPLNLDVKSNVFAYEPVPLRPGGVIPALTSPSWDNSIQGSLLLYKVKVQSLYNRPVELHISNSASRRPDRHRRPRHLAALSASARPRARPARRARPSRRPRPDR